MNNKAPGTNDTLISINFINFCKLSIVLILHSGNTLAQIEGNLSIGNSISRFWGPSSKQSQFITGVSSELLISLYFSEKNAVAMGIGILELGDQFTKDDLHYSSLETINIQSSILYLRQLVNQKKYQLNTALGISLAKAIKSTIEFVTPNSTYSNGADHLINDYDLIATVFLGNRYKLKKAVHLTFNIKLNLGLTNISATNSTLIYNLAVINQIGIALPFSKSRTKVNPF